MLLLKKIIYCICCIAAFILSSLTYAQDSKNIPILCYHNFNPTIPGSMNLTPERFAAQMQWLKDNGFTFVPLKDVVEYLRGTRDSLPAKSIVITIDDGWKSVYLYAYPIIRKYQIPVTLFIYPETISHGKNALTWEELTELKNTGFFDIQAHTYSHPNFKHAKRRLSPANYEKFVATELVNSKKILEDKMHTPITLLAWPFGIYDKNLEQAAANAGYVMAFSIDARSANKSYRPMAQPRFMIVAGQTMKTFMGIANTAKKGS